MTEDATYRRALRRETHSPRSVLAVAVACLAGVALLWWAVEAVLRLAGRRPLLLSPADTARAIADLPAVSPAVLVPVGLAVGLLGLYLAVAALSPGRRARHHRTTDRCALVVDDRALAAVLAARAGSAGAVRPEQVDVTVSRHTARVRVTPSSGVPVDRGAVADAVARELSDQDVAPPLRAVTEIGTRGVVGS